MENDNQGLHWLYRTDMTTGRVKSLQVYATCFPQERFLTAAVEMMLAAESGELLLKVASRDDSGRIRCALLGNADLDIHPDNLE